MSVTPQNARLLEKLRACLRAGDTVTEAARACGVSKHIARGLILRHGRGEAPVPVVAPPPAFPSGAPKPGGCAWPTSAGRPWTFCDAPHVAGAPYCREHMARAFIKGYRTTGERAFTLARLGTS